MLLLLLLVGLVAAVHITIEGILVGPFQASCYDTGIGAICMLLLLIPQLVLL